MATFKQITDDARVVLNDQMATASSVVRYTEAQLIGYARSALIDARRIRPDLFLSNLTGAFPDFTSSSTVPLSEDYLIPLVDYVIGRAELRDDEFSADGRAGAMIQKFKAGMLGV